MEEDLTAFLNAQVGGDIHWRRQPIKQNSFPYINLTFVAAPTGYNTTGETDTQQVSIQVDAWAETYAAAVTLARSVHAALSGYSGTQGATNFQGIWKEGEFDRDAEMTRGDGQFHLHCRSQDYRIAYS